MAGQEIVKSSKSSFMNGSPKPKQASILSFFGSQKQQQPNSSPLSKIVQKAPIIHEDEIDEMENVPPELFDEPLQLSNDNPKKVCIKEKETVKFISKPYNDSSIAVPKILNELNDAAGIDFDTSESSPGRYQWLVDIKDISGRRKGIKFISDFYMYFFFYR